MAITLNVTPENFFPSHFDNSAAVDAARTHASVLDSYANKTNPVLKNPAPPLLPTIFTPPHATPASTATCSSPPTLTSTWSGSDFGYNATVSGQMTIPNIEKVIAALGRPNSPGFKSIYPGVEMSRTSTNADGSYTYFIFESNAFADTYIGHRVKFTVTPKTNGVTVSWENVGEQPVKPSWVPWSNFYSNYSKNKVTWDFTRIGDSDVYDVVCKVNSRSYFPDPTANLAVSGMPEKIKVQFDNKLRANFSAARALFATP